MLQIPQKFKYSYKTSTLILSLLGFGAGASVLGWLSATAQHGLRVGRGYKVDFNVEETRMIYLGIAIILGLIALWNLFSLYKKRNEEVYIEINQDHLVLPDGVFFDNKPTKILYTSITDLEEIQNGSSKSLKITSKDEDYYLKGDKLPNYEIYAKIRDFLGASLDKQSTQ